MSRLFIFLPDAPHYVSAKTSCKTARISVARSRCRLHEHNAVTLAQKQAHPARHT